MEVTLKELTIAVNAQTDDQSHKSAVHHQLKMHLSAVIKKNILDPSLPKPFPHPHFSDIINQY